MLTVLLLDDDPISATHTADDLTAEGLKVIKASPFSAVGAIKSAEKVDVAILDPGRNEAGAAQLIQDLAPVPVLIHAQHASLRTAVDLMKAGAKDYWAKPASIREMLPAISRCAESKATVDATPQAVEAFVGKSKGMRALMSMANKAAQASSTVRLSVRQERETCRTPYSPVGKRTDKPLISVNCAAIETLIESELFGYEGAFTAQIHNVLASPTADGGTLFLGRNWRVTSIRAAHLLRFIKRRNSSHWIGREFERKRPSHLCNAPKLAQLENTDAFRRVYSIESTCFASNCHHYVSEATTSEVGNWLIKRVSSRLECEEKPLSEEAKMH